MPVARSSCATGGPPAKVTASGSRAPTAIGAPGSHGLSDPTSPQVYEPSWPTTGSPPSTDRDAAGGVAVVGTDGTDELGVGLGTDPVGVVAGIVADAKAGVADGIGVPTGSAGRELGPTTAHAATMASIQASRQASGRGRSGR